MHKPKEEFDLEHAILEERGNGLETLELPLSRKTFFLLVFFAILAGAAVFARIAHITYLKGDFYEARSAMNVEQPITIPAVRGIIYDRHGKQLVENESAYRLVLNSGLAKRNSVNLDALLAEVSVILKVEQAELRELVEKANLEKSALITLARNISPDQVEAVEDLNDSVLEVHDDYRRHYLNGPAFSHVLGYTGLAKFNDVSGKAGLERYYDSVLAGSDGVRLVYRNARLDILDEKLLEAPENGEHIQTTIDSGLQEYFYDSLQQALWRLERTAAVGIALDPRNGEVLALVSLPAFDSNAFTEADRSSDRANLLNSFSNPLFNRAISGAYAPGSTIKPLVALAALSENLIDSKKEIYSKGYIEIPNPYFPDQPSRFLDWKPHGWVDLRSALARSSNVYFYAVGGGFEEVSGLGIDKLKEYWKEFGFGSKTGIDLDGEQAGFLPDPEIKEEVKNDIWRLGDTYNVSIGQGDLLVTPIQLLNYITVIANGGMLYTPHLVKGVVDGEGNLVKEREPEISMNFSYLGDAIKEVQEGMKDAVSEYYGTAHLLANLPVTSAAKTGSAQIANNTKTNAFFVGYAPAENPEIAILVLIEDAKEGSLNAVPVGKDVIEWYYYNRLINDE